MSRAPVEHASRVVQGHASRVVQGHASRVPDHASRVVLEHGPGGVPALFEGGRLHVAREPAEVAPTLERLDRERAGGAWVAGWVAYEAAAAFEARLRPIARPGARPGAGGGPLLALAAFDGPRPPPARLAPPGPPALLSPPEPGVSRAAYGRAFAAVQALIAAGDCYQVNLTLPLRARLLPGASPAALWDRLRAGSRAGHAAFAAMGPGLPTLASLSPELFFRVEGGRIAARPMKGTAPRDADPARDERLAAELHASPKARAENLMIVDLLRNDIARVARVGSVCVPDLYRIESYPTVHQMTSTVEGTLAARASLSGLLPALFPCGSVTGAPKIRAMEVIAAVEPFARGPYCGAVGWMAPNGDCDFSVAIRTLAIEGRDVTIGVGGGVVADSTADGEWEEALWKARFLSPAIPGWAAAAPAEPAAS